MTNTEHIYSLFKQFPQVTTDSRKIEKNCLFFALKGENFNGNEFAQEALEKGAAYCIIDEAKYMVSEKTILVENTLQTLQDIARMHRRVLGIPVLAITGTNGKTTTKELIAAVLSEKYRIIFTQGNLNNHIGVPLTLLTIKESTEMAVVEMGANHPGEIAALSNIAEPDFGIITNIGKAHLEGFGSFEAVRKTKGELYNFIESRKGLIFYNLDNPILADLALNVTRRYSFGKSNADLTGEPVQSPPFVHAKVDFPRGVLYLNSKLSGGYNFENIMVASAVGLYFNIDPLLIQRAISNYQPSNNRSQLISKGELKILMDAYNANPTSMQASISSFLDGFEGDKYLILGDMLELGTYSREEHENILKIIDENKITNAFLVGPVFQEVADNKRYKTYLNSDILCSYLKENPIKRGAVLIKGSRGIRLEKVLEYL